jgi:hypothetical protein
MHISAPAPPGGVCRREVHVTRKSPHVEEPSENELEVGSGPKNWAAGVPGVYYSMKQLSSIWG